MICRALPLLLALGAPATADSVIAVATIQAGEVIRAEDLATIPDSLPDAIAATAAAVGLTARGTIYAGQPLRQADLLAPALVERNALIRLVYRHGPVVIETTGRALDAGPGGALVRVMNEASRTIVTGTVTAAATVTIGDME